MKLHFAGEFLRFTCWGGQSDIQACEALNAIAHTILRFLPRRIDEGCFVGRCRDFSTHLLAGFFVFVAEIEVIEVELGSERAPHQKIVLISTHRNRQMRMDTRKTINLAGVGECME